MFVAIVDINGEVYGAGEGDTYDEAIWAAIENVRERSGCDSEIAAVDRTGCLTMRGEDTRPDELVAVECTAGIAADPSQPWEWDEQRGILRRKEEV